MTQKLVQPPDSRDPASSYLWYWVAGAWFLSYALLSSIGPHYTRESAHYLLSSLPQCLSAVLALALTLPLAFAGLSGYVLDEAQRMVRHPVYVSYAVLYAVSALFSLVLLRQPQPQVGALDLAISLAVACLSSLWLYAWWVAGRLQPSMYINRLMARVHRLATMPRGTMEPVHRWLLRYLTTPIEVPWRTTRFRRQRHETLSDESLPDVLEASSQAVHIARLAMRNGATRYLDLILDRLLRYWILGSLDGDIRLSLAAGDAIQLIVPASVTDSASYDYVAHAMQHFFVQECVRGTDLAALPTERVARLGWMFREPLDARRLDDAQWWMASTALWTVGATLTKAPDDGADGTFETAAKELATTARVLMSVALKSRISRWRAESPAETPEESARRSKDACLGIIQNLRDTAEDNMTSYDILRKDRYASKAAKFTELVGPENCFGW